MWSVNGTATTEIDTPSLNEVSPFVSSYDYGDYQRANSCDMSRDEVLLYDRRRHLQFSPVAVPCLLSGGGTLSSLRWRHIVFSPGTTKCILCRHGNVSVTRLRALLT